MTHYRKCPKCGYVEPVAWHGSRWQVDWEIGDFYEFSQAYPELAKQLEKGLGQRNHVFIGDYIYWRQKSAPHRIIRLPVVIYKAQNNHIQPIRGGAGGIGYTEKRSNRDENALEPFIKG